MTETDRLRKAAILFSAWLLTINVATASPDRARSSAADLVQLVVLEQCDRAASQVDWPLQFDNELIERDSWQSLCERMRVRLMTARIDAAFQSQDLTSVMPPRQLEREEVYFVDLIMAQREAGGQAASGMSLAFNCRQTHCRLIAIHQRLLHYRHYRDYGNGDRNENIQDDRAPLELDRAMQAARLANVLALMSPLKVMLIEHYHVTGTWPDSVEALGLNPDRLHGQGIETIEILPDGGIRAQLSSDFGNGRVLDLVPAEEMSGLSIRWDCRTNLPGEMVASLGGVNCRIQ